MHTPATHRGTPVPEHGRRERFRGGRLLVWRIIAALPGLLIAGLAIWHMLLSSNLGAGIDDVARIGEHWVALAAGIAAVGGLLALVFKRSGLAWFTAVATAAGATVGVVVWLLA